MVDFTQSEHGPALTEPAPNPQPEKEVDVALPKRTTPPAFQFYPGDFLSSDKVSRMSLAEMGAYITLLCHAWLAHGLPNDHAQIARYVRLSTSRLKRLWAGPLGECFVLKGGRLVNPKQERIRADLFAFIDKQAANGRRGGRPRKPTDNPNTNPNETQTLATENPNESSSVFSLQSSNKKERIESTARETPFDGTDPTLSEEPDGQALFQRLFADFPEDRRHDDRPTVDAFLHELGPIADWPERFALMRATLVQHKASEQWTRGVRPNLITWLKRGDWKGTRKLALAATGTAGRGRTGAPAKGKYDGLEEHD